jgi:iron complex outermembrane receptor protein
MRLKTFASTISFAAVAAALGAPAAAQVVETGSQDEARATAEAPAPVDTTPADIIVTAQKRSERLQDVPLAVSVISGDALEAQGGINLENAQYLVPTLTFRKSGTSINQSLFLRGVGTSTFSIAGEPSVSTVLDGVVYSRAGEAFADLVDIERVEVLRGPQGTLFGKNASAGVVNIVSRRPTRDFEGYVEASYFDRSEYRTRAAVNLPLGESAATRIVGFYSEYDGNIINETVNRRVNGYQRYGIRGTLVASLAPTVDLTVIADWRKASDDCCAEVIATLPTNLAAAALPTPRGDRTRRIRQNLVTRTDEESYGVSGQVDIDLGGPTLTSISAYRRYDNVEVRDGDFLPQAYVGLNQLHDIGPQSGNTLSQELRLTSPGNQQLEYTIGAFYSRAESDRTFTRNDIVCNTTPAPATLIPCTAAGAPALTRPNGTATFGSVFNNLAVFGQGSFAITDAFKLIGGLRYTRDDLDVNHVRVSPLTGPGIQPSFGPFSASTDKDNVSGRAGVQYEFSRASTAYATYARGYKGPAYNIFFNLTATGTNVIEAETADSFEIGLKNTLFEGRLVLNLAAYYAKYKNYQATIPTSWPAWW